MSKSALGRGLGSLLTSRPRTPANVDAAAPRTEVTPGVAALIEGTREVRELERPSCTPDSASSLEAKALPARMQQAASSTLLRGLLFGADLLLSLQAFLFVHRAESVQTHELLLCVVAVALGATLSCVALGNWNATSGKTNL